ncbi:TetR/AcrR family transcriptional regulator [Niveibacterium sp.]|uniref:TetR/AcrR family transcriptional regulator n=1 Tax=Niveibacterium sp. TaxID=2017444 RepID=UPI0035AFC427
MRTKTEERRQRIVDIAADAFREQGFEHTSMAEIASRVGGSKATLYNYFPSKEALFVEVTLQAAHHHIEQAFTLLRPDDDLRGVLQRFSERALAVFGSQSFISIRRTVIAESSRQGVGPLFYENGPGKGTIQIENYLRAAMERGQLRQCDCRIAAQHLRGLIEAETMEPLLFRLVEGFTPAEISAIVSRALDVFFAAYGPREAR